MHVSFFNDTATTEIYTLSLHDALPISADARTDPDRLMQDHTSGVHALLFPSRDLFALSYACSTWPSRDRKSTRLNSSHANISYAVFCLKKKTLPRPLSTLAGPLATRLP